MLQKIWPIALLVLSNTFYHICSKSTPDSVNPLASLTITYAVGALCSLGLYFLLNRGGNLLQEYRQMNWTSYVLGIAIVGLECGTLYMYKVGWQISTGQIVQSAFLAIVLLFVGWAFYHESITWTKVIGAIVCLGGLYLLNK